MVLIEKDAGYDPKTGNPTCPKCKVVMQPKTIGETRFVGLNPYKCPKCRRIIHAP